MNITTKFVWAPLAITLLAFTSASEARKLFRWVDDQGKVHYSDHVPIEHSRSARSELNDQGLEINRTEAAKTEREIAREKELKRLRAEQQRLIEIQQASDRVLLRTFRSEDDMLMARNGKLTAIEGNILEIRSNIRRMKDKLADIQKTAAGLERQGYPLSKNLLKYIRNTRQQLKENYASIIRKEQGKEQIRQKFTSDLKRFRSLKNLHTLDDNLLTGPKKASLLDTVVTCSDKTACDLAWQKVETYVRENATTRLQMLSDSIIMTAAPVQDTDISITASRIPVKEQSGAELFMDLQCKNSPRGKDSCLTKEIKDIQAGFRKFLTRKTPTNAD